MNEQRVREIAGNADMIVNGYAFTCLEDGKIRVLNLAVRDRAALLDADGTMLETSMDDVELDIVHDYLQRNCEFLAA